MTREQAKQNLKGFGIAEPTDEQVTDYLNQVNGETQREKKRADQYKAEAEHSAELQAKLDEINNRDLSDIEKANKATETANTRVAELEKQIAKMQIKQNLADKCKITGEDAEKFFKEDGSVDFDTLSQIITMRETQAASLKEQEIMKGTKNPAGAGAGADTRTDAEKYVAEHYSATATFGDSIKGYL